MGLAGACDPCLQGNHVHCKGHGCGCSVCPGVSRKWRGSGAGAPRPSRAGVPQNYHPRPKLQIVPKEVRPPVAWTPLPQYVMPIIPPCPFEEVLRKSARHRTAQIMRATGASWAEIRLAVGISWQNDKRSA